MTVQIPGHGDIVGAEKLSPEELVKGLAAGGRLVQFEACISLGVATTVRRSPVVFLRPGEWGWARGWRYTLVTALLGWWGVPWGLIYTPVALYTNLLGGRDVTPGGG